MVYLNGYVLISLKILHSGIKERHLEPGWERYSIYVSSKGECFRDAGKHLCRFGFYPYGIAAGEYRKLKWAMCISLQPRLMHAIAGK